MLPLSILGFLYEEPLHGYELKSRISALTGHVKPVSDGALYPAITRLERDGFLTRHLEEGTGAAPRQVLTLTPDGRAELRRRLREPKQQEITDRNRYFTLLAFLHHLDSPAEQAAVLRRRLEFLDAPAAFFVRDGERVRASRSTSPFRRGMVEIARATSVAERDWLRRTVSELES